jgi:hypothetical protein
VRQFEFDLRDASGLELLLALEAAPYIENDAEYNDCGKKKVPILFHVFDAKQILVEGTGTAKSSHIASPPIEK